MIYLRLWLLVTLTSLSLSACNGADGRTYLFLTAEEVLSYYNQGAIDVCMEDVRDEMARAGVPRTTMNTRAAYARCADKAHRLLQDRGSDIVPEAMPGIRPSGKGRL